MKANKYRRAMALILSVSLAGLTLSGCTERVEPAASSSSEQSSEEPVIPQQDGATMSEEEILFIVTSMLPQAGEITNIYLGEGLPVRKDAQATVENGVNYLPVDSLVYPSIHQLQRASEQVFTPEYLKGFYALGFEMTNGHPPRYLEKDGVLLAAEEWQSTRSGYNWDTSTLKIVSQGEDTIVLSMDREGSDGVVNEEITLKCEYGNWRFHSAV